MAGEEKVLSWRVFVCRAFVVCTFACTLLSTTVVSAQVRGVAPGIAEPEQREAIVQLFNWRFVDISQAMPTVKKLGYSHIHVSPPEKSNEQVWQWWGRYQPIDFTKIEGPLGSEQEFKDMITTAHAAGVKIVVDVVLNHTVSLQDAADEVTMDGNRVVGYQLPQFSASDFHNRCPIASNEQQCWLDDLLDLRTETPKIRQVAKDYLAKLSNLGADGFRFDAAKHIEPGFFPNVLSGVSDKYVFGEVISSDASELSARAAATQLRLYDFALLATMRQAFVIGGDLRSLRSPTNALPGPTAVTLVRNHDIDRGQVRDRGMDPSDGKFGIGWNGFGQPLDRTDIALTYAFIMGREDGTPYVFVDMPTESVQDDMLDDPDVVAGLRFHNLSLSGEHGVLRRAEQWRIATQNAIGWQRGDDRLIVINKAAQPYGIANLSTSLQPGSYSEIKTGWKLQVRDDGTIEDWQVPARTAVMFVRD